MMIVFGNIINPKRVFVCEKFHSITNFAEMLPKYLFVFLVKPTKQECTFLNKLKAPIFYLGDLDPESLYKFEKLKAKIKKLKYGGIKLKYIQNYDIQKIGIKIKENEAKLLSKIKDKDLQNEVSFLKNGYKVEIEALRRDLSKIIKRSKT